MPRVQRGRIDSPGLTGHFKQPVPLTVVRGPHGYGKSMLAAQWLRSLADDDVDVLWFGVDRDRSGTVEEFWSRLADRLDEFALPARRGGAAKNLAGRERVVRHFAERVKPIYIVLDRYSEGNAPSEGLGQALTDLVRSSEHLFLVVCTREVTALEVVGAVMVDSLVLRPSDLALKPEEVISLAAQQSIALTREEAKSLCEATGGWPALIRVILTVSAAQRRPGETFMLDLDAGRWFLRSAWGEFTDPLVRTVIERTGFVGDFTLEIARELCAGADPRGAIEDLVAAGILTARPEADGVVFSHLPVVRREVRERLRDEDPEQFRELSSLTARLHSERGQNASALSFLVRAQLWEPLLELVEEAWAELVVRHAQDLIRMVRVIPDDVLRSSPHLVAALVQLAEDEAGRVGRVGTGFEPDLGLGASLAIVPRAASGQQAPNLAADRFALVPAHVQKRLALVMYEWAIAKLRAADPPGALAFFEEASALARSFNDRPMMVASSTGAALVNVLTGEIGQAKQWLETREAHGTDDVAQRDEKPRMGELVEIVDGFVDVGQIPGRDRVLQVLGLTSKHEADDLWALSLVIRSQVAIFADRQFEILEEFDQNFERMAQLPPNDLMSAMLVSSRVDLLLSLGQVFRARAVLNSADAGQRALVSARARVAYLAGDYGKAVLIASEALREGLRSPRLKLGVLLTLASAEAARGRRNEVIQTLREAVAASAESGFRTYFAFVRRDLLNEFSPHVPGLADIVAHLEGHFPDDVLPVPSIIAELSEREREVLVELARARSLAGVAKALYLTTNTVKTHLRSIYRKLGTHSSGETIQRAIECGLLEPRSSAQD